MSRPKAVLLGFMIVFYVVGGLNHLSNPEFYLPMMPPYLPAHLPLIYISGLAEVVLGLGLVLPQTRPAAAWGIIALLIAVFPANIHIAMNDVPLMGGTHGAGIWNWVRLPLQAVLIAWAWAYT